MMNIENCTDTERWYSLVKKWVVTHSVSATLLILVSMASLILRIVYEFNSKLNFTLYISLLSVFTVLMVGFLIITIIGYIMLRRLKKSIEKAEETDSREEKVLIEEEKN